MSVKLIIVALLAAAVSADKVVTVKTCEGKGCDCSNATEADTMTFPVGNCTTKDSKHYKVDSCGGEKIVVKQYSKEGCAAVTKTVPKACSPEVYTRATCDANEVKVYTGCSTTECNVGGTDCQTPITFNLTATGAEACKPMWGKHYKVPANLSCSGDNVTSVRLEEYANAGCTGEKKEVTVMKPCTATGFHMSTCTAGEKATIKRGCSDKACSNDCTEVDVKFNEYKEDNAEYLFLATCTADTDVTFQVYAGVTEYAQTCTGETKRAMATCAESTTPTEEPSLAPAHSVGVLALVLCLLACVY